MKIFDKAESIRWKYRKTIEYRFVDIDVFRGKARTNGSRLETESISEEIFIEIAEANHVRAEKGHPRNKYVSPADLIPGVCDNAHNDRLHG